MLWLHLFSLCLLAATSCLATDVCGMDKAYRIDCFPEISPGIEAACAARGCCYDPTSNLATERVPWCFYPSNYSSYEIAKIQEVKNGYRVALEMRKTHKYRIGDEIPFLNLDVRFETDSRLRLTFTDPQKSRFRVPIDTPKEMTSSRDKRKYDVKFRKKDFGVIVKSLHSGSVIFDTTAGPLVYADQFLQISSFLPSTKVYGLGERHSNSLVSMDWKRIVMWARDQQPADNDNLYGDHPFMLVIEDDGSSFGVFLLNSNAKEITLQPAPAVTWRTIGGILDFYIFTGPSPQQVVQQYLDVIGKPYFPPYWGLGFHLCRWGYGSSNNTWDYVRKMRDAGIPQDVQWNDIEYATKQLDFTYDKQTYDTLPQMVADIHEHGQKYMMIVDPGISDQQPNGTYPPYDEGLAMGIFINQSNQDRPIEGKVWPGRTAFPDFTNPRIVEYWTRQLQSYHDQIPFDGAWIDMNEPSNFVSGSTSGCPTDNKYEHPPYVPKVNGGQLSDHTLCMSSRHHQHLHYDVHSLYGLFEMMATHEALVSIRKKRPFIISRSTFPSSGHYGGHWTGDVHSTWADLKQSVVGVTNFNLFGIPLVGADICGFAGNSNEELCVRWSQVGAFYPFSRNHNSIDQIGQAPVDWSAKAQECIRNALMTRYSLLPYLYTLFYRAHTEGLTVARGLYLEFPTDRTALLVDEQFMWGEALLISPVLHQGKNTTDAYFPPGNWYALDFGDDRSENMIASDGMWKTLKADIDQLPLHIRGGCIIPAQQPGLNTVDSRRNSFELIVGMNETQQASGSLYWDDGDSIDTSTNFVKIEFQADRNTLTGRVIEGQGKFGLQLTFIAILGLESMPTRITTGNGDDVRFDILYNNVLGIFYDFQFSSDKFEIIWS